MKLGNDKIHVALSFDNKYIVPFYVLLTSIFINNKDLLIVFHVIATGVDNSERKLIKNYIEDNNAEILFYEIDESIVSNLDIPKNSHLSIATYYRLLFPNLLNDKTDKLLYLDVDVIVIGNLSELYNYSVYLPVAVAIDKGMSDTHIIGTYFNAGVILINILEWRKQQVSEKALSYLNEHNGTVRYQDQDALNIILANNWQPIDNKFNFTFNDIPPYLSKKASEDILKNITIIHYTGIDKPWMISSRNRFRNLYFYYMNLSPVFQRRKYIIAGITASTILKYLKVNFIELLSNLPAANSLLVKLKS